MDSFSKWMAVSRLRFRAISISVAVAAALSAALITSLAAHAAARKRPPPTKKNYTAAVTFKPIRNAGATGDRAEAMSRAGEGTFSAKLSPSDRLLADLVAFETGVPVHEIAEGGTYVVKYNIASNGDMSGMAVAKFKVRSLGKICISYTGKPPQTGGPSSPHGSILTVGGSGEAAHWHGSAKWAQTFVGLQNQYTGSFKVSNASRKKMSDACKAVAKLAG